VEVIITCQYHHLVQAAPMEMAFQQAVTVLEATVRFLYSTKIQVIATISSEKTQ